MGQSVIDCTGCTGNPGWACFRFALCLPPKSPRFLTLHRRGMTQASSFPLHLDPLYLPLMGLHSEMRSGRRNHCVRRHCHITKHLGLLQARKRSFCLLLSVSSLQIQKVHLKRVWESNNPQTYSLDGGETLAAASQVLERSDKDSKNTNVESRKHSKSRECLGLVRKGKKKEKKKALQIKAWLVLILLKNAQVLPTFAFFPFPIIPAIACLGDLLANVLDNSRSFTVRSMKIKDRYYYPLSNTPTVSTVL